MPYAARRLWTWRPSRPEFTTWSIPPRRARQSICPCRPAGQPHNCRDANAAPSATLAALAMTRAGLRTLRHRYRQHLDQCPDAYVAPNTTVIPGELIR